MGGGGLKYEVKIYNYWSLQRVPGPDQETSIGEVIMGVVISWNKELKKNTQIQGKFKLSYGDIFILALKF